MPVYCYLQVLATHYRQCQFLQVYCVYFPLFLHESLFYALLQLLNNILFDISNFSSFPKFCRFFGTTFISNLFETAWHGVLFFIMLLWHDIQTFPSCCFSHKVNFKVSLLCHSKRPHIPSIETSIVQIKHGPLFICFLKSLKTISLP